MKRRRLWWLLALVPVVVAVVLGYLLVPRVLKPKPTELAPGPTGTVNILIIGRDARAVGPVANEGQQRNKRETQSHSDIMIICHVNLDRGRVNLVSLPRDLMVRVPGVTAAASELDFQNMEKLTHVPVIGGDRLLRRTIEGLLGITIHRSIAFDFDTFRMTFGALAPFLGRLRVSGVTLTDRQQALMFARRRHGLPDDDVDRSRNSVILVRAVVNRIWWLRQSRLGELLVRRVLAIVGADTDLTFDEVVQLVHGLDRAGFAPSTIKTAVLVGEGAPVYMERYADTLSCYLPAYGEIEKQARRYLLDDDSAPAISFMTREKYRAPGYLFGEYTVPLHPESTVVIDSLGSSTRNRELELARGHAGADSLPVPDSSPATPDSAR